MNFDTLYILFSQASVLIPILFGLRYYGVLNLPFKVLFWFLVVSALFEIQAYVTEAVFHNNLPGLHLFTVTEMLALSYIFYVYFSKDAWLRFCIKLNFLLFAGVAVADALFVNGVYGHNTISRAYASISLVIYSLIYFSKLIKNDFEYHSWQYPMFWFGLSTLSYFALNLFNFMLDNYFINNTYGIMRVSVYTHAFFNIASYCLAAQSFRCFKTYRTKS